VTAPWSGNSKSPAPIASRMSGFASGIAFEGVREDGFAAKVVLEYSQGEAIGTVTVS